MFNRKCCALSFSPESWLAKDDDNRKLVWFIRISKLSSQNFLFLTSTTGFISLKSQLTTFYLRRLIVIFQVRNFSWESKFQRTNFAEKYQKKYFFPKLKRNSFQNYRLDCFHNFFFRQMCKRVFKLGILAFVQLSGYLIGNIAKNCINVFFLFGFFFLQNYQLDFFHQFPIINCLLVKAHLILRSWISVLARKTWWAKTARN